MENKVRAVKQIAQGYTAHKWRRQDLGSLAPEPLFLTTALSPGDQPETTREDMAKMWMRWSTFHIPPNTYIFSSPSLLCFPLDTYQMPYKISGMFINILHVSLLTRM